MVSVCCCAINAKYDVEFLVRTLNYHNKNSEFEIVLCHDDRVDDGSSSYFKELQREFRNFKIVHHSHEDMVSYLEQLMFYYDKQKIFPEEVREGLKENVKKFKDHQLYDEKRTFLWVSSGILYNRAIEASSGDILLVIPGDFLVLFSLKQAEEYVLGLTRNGEFYQSPNAIFVRITNHDKKWLEQHMEDIKNGAYLHPERRWDTAICIRDILKCPPRIDDFWLPNFRHQQLINLASSTFFEEVIKIENVLKEDLRWIPNFHGFHLMTRKFYDRIGGFTEEWFDRAFADDKMTALGTMQYIWPQAPPWLNIAWCRQFELGLFAGPQYSDEEVKTITGKDIFWTKHPIPGKDQPRYLYENLKLPKSFLELKQEFFNKLSPPRRIFTHV